MTVPTAEQRNELKEKFTYTLESQRAFDEAIEASQIDQTVKRIVIGHTLAARRPDLKIVIEV